ncbi:MAG: hypothetical protein J5854_04150 [Clostridia bacterium]|nr:hypothetical protein [Clostridia bacterium]
MANIEKRRKIRKYIPAIAAGASALFTAAVVILIVVFSKNSCSGTVTPPEENTPAPTAVQAEISAEPLSSVSTTPSSEPDPTENVPSASPSRVSDEMSFVLLSLEITGAEGEDGQTLKKITGSCAVQFVNNTDSPLCYARFGVSVLNVLDATVNGVPARFTVDNGFVMIPFLSELQKNAVCDIFFTFEVITDENELSLLSFGYDTAFGFSAVIRSEFRLELSVPQTSEHMEGRFMAWSIDNASIHSLAIRFRDQ